MTNDEAAFDAAPAELQDGWPTSVPQDEGLDPGLLQQIGAHFDRWRDANAHAVLIARHGNLAYERYFAGEDRAWSKRLGHVQFGPRIKHDIRSITKSITSLLVGICLDRGWIEDLDGPICSLLPEHEDLFVGEKQAITLRHLLTMSAGFAWNESLPYSDPANSERRMIDAPDQIRYVLEQPLVRSPGQTYNYSGGCTVLLAEIARRASGLPIDELAKRELFAALDISDVEWLRYANGSPNPASGLRMRPRDLAKLGQLVLDRGAWKQRTLVSAGWIDESLAPQIHGEGLYFYGLHWWLGRSLVGRQEIRWASAVGWGGQRLYVVPSEGIVVLTMAGLYDNPPLQPIVGEIVLRRYALAARLA